MRTTLFFPFLAAILCASPALSQPPSQPVTRIYEIKWRSAEDLAGLLRGFAAVNSISERFNTLTITANEKDHELIAALIRKYDVPARTVAFQFYMIKASTVGEGIKDGLPDKVRKVINEVAALTRYKNFELLDSPVLRANEGKNASLSGKGEYFYTLALEGGSSIITTEQGKRQIRVEAFGVHFSIPVGSPDKPVFKDVGVGTSFTIGDGETIVLGASQIQHESKEPGAAIITVVTAKILD